MTTLPRKTAVVCIGTSGRAGGRRAAAGGRRRRRRRAGVQAKTKTPHNGVGKNAIVLESSLPNYPINFGLFLGAFWSKTLPKPWRVPKDQSVNIIISSQKSQNQMRPAIALL